MTKNDVVILITEVPGAHGVFEATIDQRREVFCSVKSIGMQEAYQAMATGLNPELKLVIPHDFEYQGESECEFHGIRYKIIRTYVTETDGIELTIQRVGGNSYV